MKTVFVLLSITLAGAPLAIAQGTPGQATLASHVNMEVDFHVYGPETDSPGSRVSGNVSTVWTRQNRAGDYPTGTAVYNGALIGGNTSGAGAFQWSNGNAYELEVAAVQGSGPVGLANLIPSTIENFATQFSTVGGVGLAGTFPSEVITVPGTSTSGEDTAEFQIFAWYEGNSQYTSYSAALSAAVPTGYSDPFSGTTEVAPTLPLALLNARSFSLTMTLSPAPEPGTIALALVGASAFLLRRRLRL